MNSKNEFHAKSARKKVQLIYHNKTFFINSANFYWYKSVQLILERFWCDLNKDQTWET